MNSTNAPALLLIIGASYAADWGTPALGGYRVRNIGVDGQSSSDVRARFEADVLAHQPAAVLIWGHYNDVVRSPAEQIEATKARARANYQAMAEAARARGVEPLLATEITMPIPDGWTDQLIGLAARLMGKQDYRERVNSHIQDVNAWLRRYAQQNGLRLLDFEQALESGNGSRRMDFAQPDGSHVSEDGYAALTEYTRRVLGE